MRNYRHSQIFSSVRNQNKVISVASDDRFMRDNENKLRENLKVSASQKLEHWIGQENLN